MKYTLRTTAVLALLGIVSVATTVRAEEPKTAPQVGDLRLNSKDGKFHIDVPHEITEKKDCTALHKWFVEQTAHLGFMNASNIPCPWGPMQDKIGHFIVNGVKLEVPRDYLYVDSAMPDGETKAIYPEFLFPSMEPARQDPSKVMGDHNVPTTIEANGVRCKNAEPCIDRAQGWFLIKAGLNESGRKVKNHVPANKEEIRQESLQCQPIRKACMDKYPRSNSKTYDDAAREWDRKVAECIQANEVCRAAPPKKIGFNEKLGLTAYKYGWYEDDQVFFIEGDPFAPTYWLECKGSIDANGNVLGPAQCHSAFGLGALEVEYFFRGDEVLAKHRQVRQRLIDAITKFAADSDPKLLQQLPSPKR